MATVRPLHRIGATILAIVVLALAGWILQHFLLSIAWAGVLAVATWPIHALMLFFVYRDGRGFGGGRLIRARRGAAPRMILKEVERI